MLCISKDKRDDFKFFIFTYCNNLIMIKGMKHPILFTRRNGFGITAILSFNPQTIVWNVGRNGFVLWPKMFESVTLIVSSRFTVSYILL